MPNFDVKKWLQEDMGFSADDAAALAPKFEGERASKLESHATLVATTAAKQKELDKVSNDLKLANDRLSAEMAEWATLTQAEKEASQGQLAALEAARVRAAQLETRLTALATQAGVDPKPLLEGTVAVPEVKPVVKNVETPSDKRYIEAETFGAVTNFSLDLAGALPFIQQQHHELTGKYLDTRELVTEIKNRSRAGGEVDPVRVWEEKYGIGQVRADRDAAQRAADLKAAEERGAERARSEMSVPGPVSPGRHSLVFGQRNAQGVVANPRSSVLNRPQPGTTVATAAAAFRSGKYRQGAAPTVGR